MMRTWLSLLALIWLAACAAAISEDKMQKTIPANDTMTNNPLRNLRGPLAPEIASNTWLNSAPLAPADLRGKVVVVEFWTFDCINCRNTLPSVRNWYEKYREQGLVVIGVHSPEFSHERDVANVKQAIQNLHITYPVALDNDFKTWNQFNVRAWPTWFILDKQGAIRFTHVGEGAYAESEQTIKNLLAE